MEPRAEPVPPLGQADDLATVDGHLTGADAAEAHQGRPAGAGAVAAAPGRRRPSTPSRSSAPAQAAPEPRRRPGHVRRSTAGPRPGARRRPTPGRPASTSTAPPPDRRRTTRDPPASAAPASTTRLGLGRARGPRARPVGRQTATRPARPGRAPTAGQESWSAAAVAHSARSTLPRHRQSRTGPPRRTGAHRCRRPRAAGQAGQAVSCRPVDDVGAEVVGPVLAGVAAQGEQLHPVPGGRRRRAEDHAGLVGQAVLLAGVARPAGGDHVLPRVRSALAARDHVVEVLRRRRRSTGTCRRPGRRPCGG